MHKWLVVKEGNEPKVDFYHSEIMAEEKAKLVGGVLYRVWVPLRAQPTIEYVACYS